MSFNFVSVRMLQNVFSRTVKSYINLLDADAVVAVVVVGVVIVVVVAVAMSQSATLYLISLRTFFSFC